MYFVKDLVHCNTKPLKMNSFLSMNIYIYISQVLHVERKYSYYRFNTPHNDMYCHFIKCLLQILFFFIMPVFQDLNSIIL